MTNTDSDKSLPIKIAEGFEAHWREAGYVLIPIVGMSAVGILFSLQQNCWGWISFALTISLTILFLVLHFRHRPTIANLESSINDLALSLEDERRRYALLEQNYAEAQLRNQQFRRFLLKVLATDLDFGNTHRVSLYIYKKEGFVNYCRYSSHSEYTKPGRPVIPKDEPVLKEAWEVGQASGKGDGFKSRGPLDTKTANYVYRMKSINLFGFRINSPDSLDHLGVIIFESTKKNPLDTTKIISAINRRIDFLHHILSDVEK